MNNLERRASERLHTFFHLWVTRGETTRDELMEFIGEIVSGFGTAGHEIFESKRCLVEQFEREFKQLPHGAELTMKWTRARAYSEEVVGVDAEFALTTQFGNRTFTIDPVRVTCAFRLEEGELKLVQWHCSVPDASMEEEVFPGSRGPRRYEEITVALTDFVGFSGSVFSVPPKRLVHELNEIFSAFDDITREHGVSKIKTIGDAYMCACSLNEEIDDHAVRVVAALRAMFAFLEERNQESALKWAMRAGVHSGPAVGGIIGKEKLIFDLWGDTINLASRMESACEPGKINVSAYTCELIKHRYPCSYRGRIDTKDRGRMDMYFVD